MIDDKCLGGPVFIAKVPRLVREKHGTMVRWLQEQFFLPPTPSAIQTCISYER
jgi:hypothetical protein